MGAPLDKQDESLTKDLEIEGMQDLSLTGLFSQQKLLSSTQQICDVDLDDYDPLYITAIHPQKLSLEERLPSSSEMLTSPYFE
jgi:hypothetical protein